MRYVFALVALVLVLGCQPAMIDTPVDTPVDNTPPVQTAPTEEGVTRIFEKSTVAQGEMVNVKMYINLNPSQTYWLFDEGVPTEFEIQGEHDGKNRIKQIVIQDATSTVYEYTMKAPMAAGTYTFEGEYAVEGMDMPVAIKGVNQLTVQ